MAYTQEPSQGTCYSPFPRNRRLQIGMNLSLAVPVGVIDSLEKIRPCGCTILASVMGRLIRSGERRFEVFAQDRTITF
jgi:hypothetical protein